MRIIIETHINCNYKKLFKRFDSQLFESLAPPFPKVNLLRFDGSKTGDIIHIRFQPSGFEWISKITSDREEDGYIEFVDEGIQLPPGLKEWKHIHGIKKVDEENSIIIDDINYKGPNWFLTMLLYPAMFLSFYPRKRAYRKYFSS